MRQRISPRTALTFSLVLFAVFVGLAVAVSAGETWRVDSVVRDGIHRLASPPLTAMALAASFLGSVLLLTAASAIALIGFYCARWRGEAAALAWLMGGAIVFNYAFKLAIHRMRPEPYFGANPESYGFPSGHALFSCCFYLAVASALAGHMQSRVGRGAVWLGAISLIGAIGWSRIYLGVHYPSDVLGGYIVALSWTAALTYAQGRGLLPGAMGKSAGGGR